MINFVICDDEKEFINKISYIIDKIFMDKEIDIEYRVSKFDKYNSKFENLIRDNNDSKIYILDIEMKDSISGIDIARKIRKDDWNSIIIMVTSHSELGYEALKAQIMLLDFISKFDNYEYNLENILRKAIDKVDDKKIIEFKLYGISHRIYVDDILYITTDTVDRKCIIKTTYGDFQINRTINELMEELGHKFYLSHRSCLVNLDKIKLVDWKNNIIYFDNKDSINLLSRDKKKGLKDYVSMG